VVENVAIGGRRWLPEEDKVATGVKVGRGRLWRLRRPAVKKVASIG
jgi:hypothetical protein